MSIAPDGCILLFYTVSLCKPLNGAAGAGSFRIAYLAASDPQLSVQASLRSGQTQAPESNFLANSLFFPHLSKYIIVKKWNLAWFRERVTKSLPIIHKVEEYLGKRRKTLLYQIFKNVCLSLPRALTKYKLNFCLQKESLLFKIINQGKLYKNNYNRRIKTSRHGFAVCLSPEMSKEIKMT